jgi:uncharacterized protein YecE (DUF72 family)
VGVVVFGDVVVTRKKKTSGTVLIGTAGWTLPRESAGAFPEGSSHLERYSRVLRAVEINSTFHRPHRASTYARWAQSVPDDFRFCLKVPKTITHTARLRDCEPLFDAFLAEASPLGTKLDCLLFQLPPSFAFDEALAHAFFGFVRDRYSCGIACEPRHASWFEPEADRLLTDLRIARVAADPAKVPGAAHPGGWNGLRYFRWHGSPRMYYSSYPDESLSALAQAIRPEQAPASVVWCMFDNTVTGAAMANALTLRTLLATA